MNEPSIKHGWSISDSDKVAELYEIAFGFKFETAISDKKLRIKVLSECFNPEFSYVAMVDNKIVGIAGFQTNKGALTGGMDLNGLIKYLGFLKGVWAGLIFSLFERKPKDKQLVLDGIVVDEKYRGCGFGSKLLDAVINHAKKNNYNSVRLDVIDSNPRAKKLYLTKGFIEIQADSFPYLKWLIGFSGSSTMIYEIKTT